MTVSSQQLKRISAYVLLVAGAAVCIVGLLRYGASLHGAGPAISKAAPQDAAPGDAEPTIVGSPIQVFLLQVIVIVLLARALGWVMGRIHQPSVIGEILAGILLGPSVLGAISPATMEHLFPPASLPPLKLLAEMGVILFMFLVGMETHIEQVQRRAHSAVLVSHASIVVPFVLGVGLALGIFESLAPPDVGFVPFALFMGVGMSITAFPVLARILEERGLTGTVLGATALTCAMVDDVTAWCLLALVVALVNAGSWTGTVLTALLSALFAAVMLWLVRPAIVRWARPFEHLESLTKGAFALVVSMVFLSAFTTETIGIHSVFGAFLAGIVIPKHAAYRVELKRRLDSFVSILLLPIFFAYTGLRTDATVLFDGASWKFALAILAIAVAGKLGGSMLAARVSGMNWRMSFALGVLMNTRGLVGLIVLNIGYDLGILSPRVYAIMVLVAFATTIMAGPLLWLVPPIEDATQGTTRPLRSSLRPRDKS